MNSVHIGYIGKKKPDITAKAIHIQRPDGANFKNICGNGNANRGKPHLGPPQPDSIFFKALKNNLFRCCPTCIKAAIKEGLITVKINRIDEEPEFQPCDNCDLPDACADMGCAVKQGLKQEEW